MSKKRKSIIRIMVVILITIIFSAAIIFVIKDLDNPRENHSEENVTEETELEETILEENISEENVVQEDKLDIEEEKPADEVVLTERVEANYEKWLSAGMIIAVSMQYPEFDFTGIYIASETQIEDRLSSYGAYVSFRNGNEEVMIHSRPLSEERKENGTRDLYTPELGFATFDEISKDDVDFEAVKEVKIEDISELISQSMLVSIYEH